MERRAVRSCFYAQPGRIFVMWREFWLVLQKSTFLENTRYAPASAPSSDEPGYASNARDSFLSAVGGRRSRVGRVQALRQWCLPAELLDGEAEKHYPLICRYHCQAASSHRPFHSPQSHRFAAGGASIINTCLRSSWAGG